MATVVTFMGNVGERAVKIAAENNRSAVDHGEVTAAYDIVSGRSAQRDTWLLALAGLLGGGAIASAVAVLLTPPQALQWAWWLAILVIGIASLILLFVARPKNR